MHAENEKRVMIQEGDYSAEDLKYIIGQCDFFIGSRMHSCIAALSMKVPTISLSYSHKFNGIMQSLRQENNVCNLKKHDHQMILSKILEAYTNKSEIQVRLEKQIPLIEKKVYQCADLI